MEERSYTVYKHVNKTNGKVYIGITSGDVQVRWQYGGGYKGSPHFNSAIQKYGWSGFDHEIVRDGLSKEEACIAERKLIKRYNSRNPNYGYNISCGGEAGCKGRRLTEEEKEYKRIASLMAWSDPVLRLEQSKRLKGRPKSEETRRRMSEARKGEVRSEEQKAKISETLKAYYSDPANRKKNSDSKKKCPIRCVETGEEYESSHDAFRHTGVSQGNIYACCLGKRKRAGGFHWEFISIEEKVAC